MMKQRNKIIYLAILSFMLSGMLFAQKKERLQLVHADVFKRVESEQGVVQQLIGNVRLKQGETTILCDRAVQKVKQNLFELIGNVRIFDTKKTLLADTVFVFEEEKRQVASGHVVSITEKDTTKAKRITYFELKDRILSEGSVRIVNPEKLTILEGEWAEYFRQSDFGKVSNNANFIQYDSVWVEQTRILADTLQIFKGGEETVAINNVSIINKKNTATCGYAKYYRESGEIVLEENPVIEQPNQKIQGDTLRMFLQESKLSEALVSGNAVAVSDADTLERGRWQNKLTGQSMRFYFAEEEIQKVVIENQAASLYHIIEDEQYKGANELSGDKIIVHFNDGKVERVLVTSNPDVAVGSYSPAK